MNGNRLVLKDPLEIMLCLVFLASGVLQFFTGTPASSAAASLDPTSRALWLVFITLGSLITIIGIVTPYVRGYLVEQVGLMAVGGALVAYGAQVTWFQISHGTLSPATALGGPLLSCIGAGFIWKWNQVRSAVKTLAKQSWGDDR